MWVTRWPIELYQRREVKARIPHNAEIGSEQCETRDDGSSHTEDTHGECGVARSPYA